MNNPEALPQVGDGEMLARFVVSSGWFRKSDNTIKQDAFVPFPHLELSVTRHINLSPEELWEIGESVASAMGRKLYGSADILAQNVKKQSLDIKPTATPKNHANIVGWPKEKPSQKMLAQELAACATFVRREPTS